MNHPYFTKLRRCIDHAITFYDLARAYHYIGEGLRLAGEEECPGEAMYFRAQEAIVEGHPLVAVDFLKKALIFNSYDGAAYNDMALCLVEMGKIEGVLEVFDQGIAVEADYATIHHNKGWLLNKLGRPTEALICFEKALSLEPERAVTWENMADAYEALGRYTEALKACQKALQLLPVTDGGIREQLESEIKRLMGHDV
ncbi:MAG: tetratricopeptide repeat protein [Candidatus Omnitrophota bacterium]